MLEKDLKLEGQRMLGQKEAQILRNFIIRRQVYLLNNKKVAGHRCGCMLAKQMGGYIFDGSALSG